MGNGGKFEVYVEISGTFTKINNVNNLSFTSIGNAIGFGSFDVSSDDRSASAWRDLLDSDIRIYWSPDTGDDVLYFGGVLVRMVETQFIHIIFASELEKMNWYQVLSDDGTSADVNTIKDEGLIDTYVSNTRLQCADLNGDLVSWADDQWNDEIDNPYYVQVVDNTLGEDELEVKRTVGADTYTGSGIGNGTNQAPSGGISGSEKDVEWASVGDTSTYLTATEAIWAGGDFDFYVSMGLDIGNTDLGSNRISKTATLNSIEIISRAYLTFNTNVALENSIVTVELFISATSVPQTPNSIVLQTWSFVPSFNSTTIGWEFNLNNNLFTGSAEGPLKYNLSEIEPYIFSNTGTTYWEGGYIGYRIKIFNSDSGALRECSLKWDAMEVKLQYDSGTFNLDPLKIEDTLNGYNIDNITDGFSTYVSHNDKWYIAPDALRSFEKCFTNMGNVSTTFDINNGELMGIAIFSKDYGRKGYELLRTYATNIGWDYFEQCIGKGAPTITVLHEDDWEVEPIDLDNFTWDIQPYTENNKYGKIVINYKYGFVESDYISNNIKTYVETRKDLLTEKSVREYIENIKDKYSDYRRNHLLKWDRMVEGLQVGKKYSFTTDQSYSEVPCIQVTYNQPKPSGSIITCEASLGGGHTPDDEYQARELGLLKRKVRDDIATSMIADYSGVTRYSQLSGLPDLVEELSDLSDVNTLTPSSGQVLKYNGSKWDASAEAISDHNDLTSIQGGSSTERYHLTSAQHTELASIVSDGHNALDSLQGGTTDEYYHLTEDEHTELSDWALRIEKKDYGTIRNGSYIYLKDGYDEDDLNDAITELNSGNGGTIYIPESSINLTAVLTIATKPIKFIGTGIQSTIWTVTASSGNIMRWNSNGCTIENIQFKDTGTPTDMCFVYSEYDYLTVHHCEFNHATNTDSNNTFGVKMKGTYNQIHNNLFLRGNVGIYMNSLQYSKAHNNQMHRIKYGLYVKDSDWNIIQGNEAILGTYGIRLVTSDENNISGNSLYCTTDCQIDSGCLYNLYGNNKGTLTDSGTGTIIGTNGA